MKRCRQHPIKDMDIWHKATCTLIMTRPVHIKKATCTIISSTIRWLTSEDNKKVPSTINWYTIRKNTDKAVTDTSSNQ